MTGSPLLQVRGLSVVFHGFQALTGLDFAVGAGELRFLIGPNGAGKTTLMLSVEGLDVAYGRAQALFGVDLQVPPVPWYA